MTGVDHGASSDGRVAVAILNPPNRAVSK